MEESEIDHHKLWPHFDLHQSWRNAKIRKKVFLVDSFRNAATLEAIRFGAQLQRGEKNADFSNIDLQSFIHSIPPHIQINPYHLQDTRRQVEQYNKAPAWEHAKPELKATFYQLAMQREQAASKGNLIHTSFTLDLTPAFVAKAMKDKKGFLEYTKRKIDGAFKKSLGRQPQYWFVVELEPIAHGHQRPHLHGAILITQHESESVRKQITPISAAFHKAVGKCSPDFSNRLLHLNSHGAYAQQEQISEIEAAINWPGYCLKHNTFARLLLNLKGNLTADNATKRQAAALYALLSPT